MVTALLQCVPYLIGFCFKEVGYTLCTAFGVIVCVIEVAGALLGAGNGTSHSGQALTVISNVLVTVVFLGIYVNRSKTFKKSASPEPAKLPPDAAESPAEPPAPDGAPRRP
jgi:hypothetical protein